MIYSTLIGGSGFEYSFGISVDQTGAAYITGETYSSDFLTGSQLFPGNSGYFFFRINSTLSDLLYSNRGAEIKKVLVDDDSHVIVIGTTSSGNFPYTQNAYDTSYNGMTDIFIAKIDVEKDSIVFLTFLGGSGDEESSSIAFDSQKNLIITGSTNSTDFPVKGKAFESYTEGESQYFITKLNSYGSDILFSVRLRSGGKIATDVKDNIYIAGTTSLNDLPITPLAYDTSHNGGNDGYLMKLNSDCSQLIYSTYIGGASKDEIIGFAVDKSEKLYIAGSTRSADFPVTSNALDTTYNGCAGCEDWAQGDVYFSTMDPTGKNLEYSTYLGTTQNDELYGMTMDISGNVYLAGVTVSSSFPTTKGAYRRAFNSSEAYLMKFYFDTLSPMLSVTTNNLTIASISNSKAFFGIISNTRWKVSNPETWLTVNRMSGLNNDSIILTAKANTTASLRTATITISGSGVEAQTITVNQDGLTGIEENEIHGTKIIPNPSNGQLTINFGTNQSKEALVEIFNLQGNRLLLKTFRNTTSANIDLTGNPAGMYLLKVSVEGTSHEVKILKE